MAETPPTDLLAKYNKLAAEYAKMRAQLPVLKRALLEEQGRKEEVREELGMKDQAVRKLEQEVDSLTFRNKQLERRIGVLQNELVVASAKGKGKKGAGTEAPQGPQGNSASLDYELVSKIEENMILQKQLSDLEQSSNIEIAELRAQLESANNEETHKVLILNELTSLKDENQTLAFALQNSLDEIEAYKEQATQLRERIATPVHVPAPSHPAPEGPILSDSDRDSKEDELDPLSFDSKPLDLLDKLTLSERQKEHWTVEYQLLKMKYERVIRKWEDCKEAIRSIGREDLLEVSSSEVTSPVMESAANLLGSIDVIANNADAGISGRHFENEVKEFLTKKINDLVALLQCADSRAIHFYNECQAMQSLLSISYDKVHKLEEDLKSSQCKESGLKEEFDLTKDNYETQLTQLSEHLAIMNEKIAEKQELINELQLKLKGKK